MSLIIPANSAVSGGFNVDNSCMFNSSHLTRTISDGSNTKSTYSSWIKRSGLSATQYLFHTSENGSNDVKILFNSGDVLRVLGVVSGSTVMELTTNRVFRDSSAWMHILVVIDTTQATAANRVKMYINGVQETSFSTATYPAEDYASLRLNNNGDQRTIGTNYDGGGSAGNDTKNGMMAEVVWSDGQTLAPTDFGEYDEDSGIWKPIKVSGLTFGDNGFYLDFEDSSALGNDAVGSNNFSVSGISATNQATDTPTNNFCTLNPLAISAQIPTYSQGNCQSVSDGGWHSVMGTMGFSSGKWYWEVKVTTSGGNFHGILADYVNFADATVYNEVGSTTYTADDGGEIKFGADTTTANYGAVGQNDITGIAINMDDKQISIYDNGSAIISNVALDDAANLGFVLPLGVESGATVQWNFGGCSAFALTSAVSDANDYGNFEYAPPTGYFALCTKNLAEYG